MMAPQGQTWPSEADFPDLAEVSVIARGAHATVYGAFQVSAGREVALKIDNRVLPPDSDERRRFQQEARAVGRLSQHPGIIDTYIAGFTSQGHPYMVTELCRGSYADRLAKDGPLNPDAVQRIGVRIADALAEAHEHRVLHRDIKPANLLVDSSGNPVLADFGVASLMDSRVGQPVVRAAMTPAYAPLETFHLRPSGEPGDVYSLSATLYTLLSGRPPRFPADDRDFTIDDVIGLFTEPIGDVPGVSQTLLGMLRAAMTNNPEGRPSAMQFRDMLDSVPVASATAAIPVATRSTPPAPAAPPAPRRPEWSEPVPARAEPAAPERRPSPGPSVSPSPRPRHASWGVDAEPSPMGPPPPVSDNLPVPVPMSRGRELEPATRRERRIQSRGGKESSGMGQLILVGAIAVTIIVAGAIFAVWAFTGGEPTAGGKPTESAAECDVEKFGLNCVDPPLCFTGKLTDGDDMAAAEVINCKDEHRWEAYGKGELPESIDSPAYGVVIEQKIVTNSCLKAGDENPLMKIMGMEASKWNSDVLPPTKDDFDKGSRTFYCVAEAKDGKDTTGSAF